MSDWTLAGRMMQATRPKHIAAMAFDRFDKFAAEVEAEAGVQVLRDIVLHLERHAALTRGQV